MVTELISWLNIVSLLVATIFFPYSYIKSVAPAALEKKIGEIAYAKCGRYRRIAAILEIIITVNYIIYAFFPLFFPFLPQLFPWDWWISFVIGVIVAIPAFYIMYRGIKDAGEEAMTPKKEHTMYGGIYKRIRHPQSVGGMFIWFVIALILHSPFLVLYSFVWFPIIYLMCKAEERDLVIRYGETYEEYLKNTSFFISIRRKRHEKQELNTKSI